MFADNSVATLPTAVNVLTVAPRTLRGTVKKLSTVGFVEMKQRASHMSSNTLQRSIKGSINKWDIVVKIAWLQADGQCIGRLICCFPPPLHPQHRSVYAESGTSLSWRLANTGLLCAVTFRCVLNRMWTTARKVTEPADAVSEH